MLIARFRGDVEDLTSAYERAHSLIMSPAGPCQAGS